MDKIGESDFSPGATSQGQLLPQEKKQKQRGLAARFSRPSSSTATHLVSSFFGRKSTSPLVPVGGVPMEEGGEKSPAPLAIEESSDSEYDHEDPSTSGFTRKVSTNKDIMNTVSLKEGYLMKQTSSFQRWHKRYFKIKGKKLFYGKDEKAQIFDEIDLREVTVAESSSSKSVKHSFQVITPHRVLNLGSEKRAEMEEWMGAVRSAADSTFYESGDHSRLLSGAHVWYATSHARPTYCNICREQLCGVTSHGLSCEICKFKAHKRCASKAQNNCKWTTLASMGKDIIEENDGVLALPHQWLEGNLPVSAKCDVCEKTCGSVLRLQDWRCLWCRTVVHNNCRSNLSQKCPLGKLSVVPPTALHTIGSDDAWESSHPLQGCSPLLVFVNSKSGDHQGLKFLRRFKQLLNPAQVFDLMNGGPRLGLQLFRHFEPFRILVCGGDGSVGWVMAEIDRLDMHRQCQVGVLPLGTGNDLARVLGWGASCDDDAHLPHLLEKYEKATTKMLDRWSVLAFERGIFLKPNCSEGLRLVSEKPQIAQYEDSVVSHLQNILQSNQHQTVINSAKVLCETVRDMIGKIGSSSTDSEIDEKCANLSQKLNSLLQTLNEETEVEADSENCGGGVGIQALEGGLTVTEGENKEKEEKIESAPEPTSPTALTTPKKGKTFRKREVLMLRANSLKKAVRQIIEHAERALDETTTPPPIVIVRPMTLSMQSDDKECQVEGEPLIPLLDMQNSTIKLPLKSLVTPNNNDNPTTTTPSTATASEEGNNCNLSSLPVPKLRGCEERKLSNASTNSSIPGGLEMEDEIADDVEEEVKCMSGLEIEELEQEHQCLDETDICPKIEIESPSSSSPQKTQKDSDLSEEMDVDISLGLDSSVMTLSGLEHNQERVGEKGENLAQGLAVPGTSGTSSSAAGPSFSSSYPRGASPRASRRISMGSLFKPLEVDIPSTSQLQECFSSSANSAHSSPNKSYLREKRKTLPIVNPLVNDPSWPSIASGGVVGKVLLSNADAICAVASPLMDPDLDHEELMIGFDEKCVMNNYFGIGIDAKITLDFHLKREEHPEKCRSRTRNFVWYGVLGGKEFLQKSCKNLEQKVLLECDGKRLPLPSLQGIVILNIQSFMGGTNFWGGTKEDDCFLAPSFDDRILEVVAVFDTMQMAASRLINLQHHRIAQCQSIKITIVGDEPIPVQVDGEAWLQAPGVIRIIHKNRMQMLCRNRALESCLKAWEEKQKHHHNSSATHSPSPTADTDELAAGGSKQKPKSHPSHSMFKLSKFKNRKDKEKRRLSNEDCSDGGVSISDETGSFESKSVEKWTASEVTEWLDYLSLSEYKPNFLRHDIQGSELVNLQRRDLRELGVTKVGHIKRILHSVEKLKAFIVSPQPPIFPLLPTTSTPAKERENKSPNKDDQDKPHPVSKQTSL